MSRNGSGTYVLPAGQPVVTGTTISSTTHNTLASDLANALTTSIATDGQSVISANIPFSGFKATGLGAATVAGDAIRFEQVGTLAAAAGANNDITSLSALTSINGGSPFGFKNRIINGAMVIDQRNAGASVTPTDGQYLVDRWFASVSQASKFSAQQNAGGVTPPAGFTNYLGITSLSAYSLGAGDYFSFRQKIEGFNVADFGWGTSSAQPCTFSFRVYSSLTGTFGGVVNNSAQNRSYPFIYAISAANTFTTVYVTIPGDTGGTWLTNNGVGIGVQFGLGVGSTYSGTAGAWAAANYISATGATSVVGTSGATFYITGVQLEKGGTATAFDYRDYGRELIMCQRYGQPLTQEKRLNATSASGTYVDLIQFVCSMRANPSVTLVSAGTLVNMNAATISSVTSYSAQSNYVNGSSGDAYITNRVYFLSAEL